ncbi:hypothetical protein HUT19_38890 [Streptomyces sp. NA02950]|nr:hypothetical protein HUT19_38890 [Streptomyces sp. NA02950]
MTFDDAFLLPDVAAAPPETRGHAAQLAITAARRARHPHRTTWGPSDRTEPAPVPAEVIDGDGDIWRRGSSAGTWYMPGWDRTVHDERCADFLSRQELVDEFGPLTAVLTTLAGNTTADGG